MQPETPSPQANIPQSQPKEAALRKRTQITKANRTMFLWIAGASALLGFAIVISIFLVQKLVFNEKVLAEQQNTVSTLQKNNAAVPQLEDAVRVLDTNEDLAKVKAQPDDQAVQVILDALPYDANPEALGSSLQERLLADIGGIDLQTLQIDPLGEGTDSVIGFRFVVAGDQSGFRDVLNNLERSIRTIKVTSLNITSSGGTQTMTVVGQAFYAPAYELILKDKAVSP